ncbi:MULTISPECIES: DUF3618 domain-containing protein [Nocardiopsis]|uniref:ElaB/YqjD/DUF883 family membrane-anchored ribosome-binding protein n=1 Tax=Nocardiopsis sinuspersici TaxID=501010 RepID=A0A1V3C3Q5_9ACTN|nr:MULTISPECIES: DUF3618 domain-containing protein [Nocardiopsis]NYH51460.1 ElaB/YqjD/DUF883 family membrane-anchored ribosome-binding protein [Nocardiopsis sinuspersici]OOC55099.1 hypothetical protein NOSIN_15860 [Nocardiopsis sinuspersici]
MGETPDQIRHDIERTRSELTHDTDRLANRADPRNIVERRTRRVRDRAQHLRNRVMGSTPSSKEVSGEMRQTAHQATEMARSVPQQAAHQAQGNPIAAGLIAFGAGLLAASVISESRAEQRAAQRVSERAGPVIEPAKQAVTESAEHVKEQATESARSAGEHLKGSASEAAHKTGEHAQHETKAATEEMRRS